MLSEFTQQMKAMIGDSIGDIHTILTGKIVSFNFDTCEAVVLPYGKFRLPSGAMMDYPQLNDVPVYIMQGNGQMATIVYPISPGDECIILVSEVVLDTWRKKAETSVNLRFDLSNTLVIVGMFAQPNPLIKEACEENAIIIEKSGQRVKLTCDSITLEGVNVTIKASGDINMSAKNVNVNAEKTIRLSAPNNPDGVFSAVGWTASITELKP